MRTARFSRIHGFRRKIILVVLGITTIGAFYMAASGVSANNTSVVTVYSDGEQRVITTEADTVGDVLDRLEIQVENSDIIEPSRDTSIASQSYHINVYRARPVIIKDGETGEVYRTASAHQSPRAIVEEVEALEVHQEDKLTLELVTDFLNSDFIGHKVVIERATPVDVKLMNKETVIRTHASTVREMFEEADVEIKENDIIKPGPKAAVKEDMEVTLVRVGYKTITKEEPVEPPTETINDNDQPLGYEKVQEKGESGLALVTYEVEYRNGTIVDRKQVHRVVEREPESRVVIMGRKFSLDRAFAQLRLCESGGDYQAVNRNPGVNDYNPDIHDYYGAYQFNQSTWNSYAPPGHVGKRPDTVEAAIQDRVALRLYNTRGWQPWPVCGAGLPHQ